MLTAPVSPDFNFAYLLKSAIQQEYEAELQDSNSATPIFEDDESSLSSLPPSPTLSPTSGPSSIPSIFLRKPDQLTADSKSPQIKKNPAKRKAPRRQQRQTKSGNASRKKRRTLENDSVDAHHAPRQNARRKHLGTAEASFCNREIEDPSLAKGAYIALESEKSSRRSYSLSDLTGDSSKHKFRLQEWDGSHSVGIVDSSGRIIVILAGHPDDKDWPRLQSEAAEALELRRSRCSIPKENQHHRRGRFSTLNCGVSFGGGQRVPGNLYQTPENEQVLSELHSLEPFKRVAGFSSSVMATWAPELHEHYQECLDSIHAKHPNLKRLFPRCIFCAASYNFGPKTVCYPHNDMGNLPYGMCAVTPFGTYDYKKGGHLVLWELKLVVEFPPGCTILLPSAILTHSNTSIGNDERRYSFAQYTAGGLFRWVDQGFQTQDIYRSSLTSEELANDAAMLAKRWETGLSLIPTVENI